MKKLSLLLVLALVLVFATSAVASGLPGSGWWSGETIMNVGTETATIQVTAYAKDSTDFYTASEPVEPGAYYNFIPNSFEGMPSGFQGSAVVSANQPVKAIVNVTNRQANQLGVAGGKAAAQYQGIDGTMVDSTIYFPIAKGDYYNKTTTYYIQNAGIADTTATATFKMANGDEHTYTTPTIKPNQMVLFSIWDTATYTPGASPESRIGAVTVVATEDIAGVVMEHFTTEAVASLAQSTRGFTSSDFGTTAFAPLIKNTYYLRFTGIQVQNVGAVPIDITVTYKGFDGTCTGMTYMDTALAVQPGKSAVFNQLPGQTNLPTGCGASATINTTTVGGQLVALVSESYVSSLIPATGQRSVTSFAIPANSTTQTVSAPVFKDDHYGKRTGLLIQNVGGAQANNVVATFSCSGDATFTAVSKAQTIASGAAFQFYHPSTRADLFEAGSLFNSDGVLCSVTITADQSIVALANEAVIPGGTLSQDNNNYEGFNLP